MTEGELLRIHGVVQGVGFRPHVWRLAREYSLNGSVRNEGGSVVIELWGAPAQRDAFVDALQQQAPPLSKIETLVRQPFTGQQQCDDFIIEESRSGSVESGLSADAAICDHCLQELNDSQNRRYHYPFINCTHCGPRFSISRAIPYDRNVTSMASFPLCEACAEEYASPVTRRFHAQATACPECGPRVWLNDSDGTTVASTSHDAMSRCAQLLAAGKIVAIKGIGGFHLACDATNNEAVMQLRQRKQRPEKPFAIMVTNIAMARSIAHIGEAEERLLGSPATPIVLLGTQANGVLSESVSPGLNTIGCMLAYSGLHHLLLEVINRPLVMTSGNCHGEVILADNEEAQSQLKTIADYFLLHDREIVNRLDDSVVRVMAGEPRLLRRARGYVPNSLPLPEGFEDGDGVLAMGAEIKNSFCLLHRGRAMLSPYMGELSALSNYEHYQDTVESYSQLFHFTPQHIAIDLHPEYHSSKLGVTLAQENDLTLLTVQHHHAHIAACMVEHGLVLNTKQVLGIVLDGIGYGDDGTLWGGEFLIADYREYQRIVAFDAVPLPGGDAANREPWRNAFAHLHQALGWGTVLAQFETLPVTKRLNEKPLSLITAMIRQRVNSPLSSSCGRLFDAVAAMLGICFDAMSYEGQAAMQLEQLAASRFSGEQGYPVEVQEKKGMRRLTWRPMWESLMHDLKQDVAVDVIAARFHHSLINALVEQALWATQEHDINIVVLSGGVYQNRLISDGLSTLLEQEGLRVLLPKNIPTNDGGVALGQAVISAAHQIKKCSV